MTRPLLSKGIYIDGLRRLRVAGIFLTALCTVLCTYPLILSLFGLPNNSGLFSTLYWPLTALPHIAAPVLAVLPLSFQNHRIDSDFYHALPFSKVTLSLSNFAASATWCAVTTVVPALFLQILGLLNGNRFSAGELWFNVLGSFTASLFVIVMVMFAAALCGKTVSTVCTSVIILYAPPLIAYTLSGLILGQCPILPPDSNTALLDAIAQNLLYSGYNSPSIWIATVIKILLIGALALWASSKRPGEIAGRAALSPLLHGLFRTLLAVVLSLPAVSLILQQAYFTEYVIYMVVPIYILVIAVYYLYEILTTRSVKALLKATAWLPLVAVLNIAMVGGCFLGAHIINYTSPSADEIDSVSLSRIVYRMNDDSYINETGYGYSAFDMELSGYLDDFSEDDSVFYRVTKRYAQSDAPQVRLTDDTSRRIASAALKRHIDALGQPRFNIYNSDIAPLFSLVEERGIVYLVDVTIRDGWFTHDRRIGMTEEELGYLLGQIEEEVTLPHMMDSVLSYDLYQGCTFYNEELGAFDDLADEREETPDAWEEAPDAYFHIRDDEGTIWLTAEHLQSAEAQYVSDEITGETRPTVLLRLTDEGSALFYEATLKAQGEALHICYGENVLFSPVVNTPIRETEILLSSEDFATYRDAEGFADLLNGFIADHR